MIQDIFLPEKIKNYYIFRQRMLGIDITKTHIHATLAVAQGASITVETQISRSLNGDQANHEERVVSTLTSIFEEIGPVDQIRTSLASNVVVFKELRLPFTTRDKIRLVIPFEVGPLLPFPVQEAEIDFIITSVNEEQKSALVLVAAVQKKHIAERLSLFSQAGHDPSLISVDMFALFGLFREIPSYQSTSGAVGIIDLGMHSTSLIAVLNQEIRVVRTLAYGLATAVKDAGASADLKPQQVMDHLLRFGVQQGEADQNKQIIQNSLTAYFKKLHFALSSTFNKLQIDQAETLFLCGVGADIKDIAPFCQKQLETTCNILDIQKLTENKLYRFAPQVNPSQSALISLATALPTETTEGFNLLQGEFAPSQHYLLLKQSIVAGVLLVILLGTLIGHTIIQSSRLSSEIEASQEETIEALKERFPEIPEDEQDLEEALTTAKTEFENEMGVWRAFSAQTRSSFLEYLLELTSKINKQELGFVPKKITITDGDPGEITLQAEVRDWDALKKLEQALKDSKLFGYVEGQSDTSFTMRIRLKQTA